MACVSSCKEYDRGRGKKKQRSDFDEPNFDDLDSVLLGRIGFKPWELHRITYREAILAIKGLFEQNEFYSDLARTATSYICASGMNGAKVVKAIDKYWPTRGKKKRAGISESVRKQLEQLRQNPVGHAGRTKISS